MSFEQISKSLDALEAKLNTLSVKESEELKSLGKVTADTKTALDNLGIEQRTLAERLASLEQKGLLKGQEGDEGAKGDDSYGSQFVKSAEYTDFITKGMRGRFGIELKNTVTNTIAGTYSDRKPGIVPGQFRTLTIESLLTSIPTSANSIDWMQEGTFTNSAAEVAEGAQKPESSLTMTPKTTPVVTVAHFIKVTKQLASDNRALMAYINTRMVYGVNLRVENQILTGNGTAPNLSGLLNTGNFTAHGYTAASLTAAGLSNNRFDLIGKTLGDSQASDYPADAIIVNPTDWWTMRLAKDSQGRYLLGDPGSTVAPGLFGLPVVTSNAITAGQVIVANLGRAATLHTREGMEVAMSDSDGNNFQLNLYTLRAERRLALSVEVPAAIRAGALVPA
jgi:HK97 family phage major capsid protein